MRGVGNLRTHASNTSVMEQHLCGDVRSLFMVDSHRTLSVIVGICSLNSNNFGENGMSRLPAFEESIDSSDDFELAPLLSGPN